VSFQCSLETKSLATYHSNVGVQSSRVTKQGPILTLCLVQIVKPFLDPKTFRKVKFVYSKNAESMKILSELFDEDTLKGTFDNPNDYNHEQYSKLMQEDDLKSSLHWKGGETITESKGIIDTPDVDSLKIEEPVENGHTEAPVVSPVVAAS
jgi:hypothetical protein